MQLADTRKISLSLRPFSVFTGDPPDLCGCRHLGAAANDADSAAISVVFAVVLLAHFLIWPGSLLASIKRSTWRRSSCWIGNQSLQAAPCDAAVIGALLAVFVVTMGAFAYVVISGGAVPERKTVWTTALGISGCFTLAESRLTCRGWVGSVGSPSPSTCHHYSSRPARGSR